MHIPYLYINSHSPANGYWQYAGNWTFDFCCHFSKLSFINFLGFSRTICSSLFLLFNTYKFYILVLFYLYRNFSVCWHLYLCLCYGLETAANTCMYLLNFFPQSPWTVLGFHSFKLWNLFYLSVLFSHTQWLILCSLIFV